MVDIVQSLDRLIARISGAAAAFGCAAILIIAVAVTANAVSRYAFNAPSMFVDEYAQYLFVCCFYFGVGYTLRQGKHVSVDMMVNRLPQKLRALFAVAILLLSAMTIGVMCYYSWTAFHSTYRAGIVSLTPMETPLALPFLAVAIGMTIFTLELLVLSLKSLVGLQPPIEQ